MQEEERTEGVILQTIPFQDFHEILKVFTRDYGVMSFLRKYGRSKNREQISPLYRVEVVFQRTRSDMHRIVEVKVLESFLQIRKDFDCLTSAISCIDLLKKSQLPEDPSCELYQLLIIYLKHFHEAPLTLELSFMMKLLRFAGHLSCTSEGQMITPAPHLFFTKEEEEIALILTFGRSLKLLKEIPIPLSLKDKIPHLAKLTCDL